MQYTLDPLLMVFLIPSLLIGMGSGYVIAGQIQLSVRNRVAIIISVGFMGGLIIGMILVAFTSVSGTYYFFLQILSCTGGTIVGAASNWAPVREPSSTHYVTFDPDDDDEFDRQIEEAMGER
ncbi:hypothetical protein EU538_01180 [Candidatus Thorarchaeota archaeon]|jgi:hypothetical protein|nr:MAG: hypothetical protein EU538_01180 [Candidatus Thorarchaeota archaeon]